MGCDIHSFAERKTEDGWEIIEGLHPFDERSYGVFGFLANVRNYSAVPPIAKRRGVPADATPEVKAEHECDRGNIHSASWLSLEELETFDYDASMEDRRVTRDMGGYTDGGCTCDPGEGAQTIYREFLGNLFFDDLKKLKDSGANRIVFWFDN